jgi:hypothetical protein
MHDKLVSINSTGALTLGILEEMTPISIIDLDRVDHKVESRRAALLVNSLRLVMVAGNA